MSVVQPLILEIGQVLPWSWISRHEKASTDQLSLYQRWLRPFEMPGGSSAPVENIHLKEDGIVFSASGYYFFSLFCACIKVLVRQPDLDEQERCIEIADFAFCCTVHTMADYWQIANGKDQNANVAVGMAKLFLSNQPLGLACGQITAVLISILASQGYPAQRLWFYKKDTRSGHIVVYVPITNGGIILDADVGVAIPWTPQELLADRINGFSNVPYRPLRPKRQMGREWVLSYYSRSAWAWQPSFSTGGPTFIPANYTKILANFCEVIDIRKTSMDDVSGILYVGAPTILANAEVSNLISDVAGAAVASAIEVSNCSGPKSETE